MCAAISPGKMTLPPMKAWIEEWRRLSCFRIEAVGFAPFEFITAIACGAQVFWIIVAAEYLGHDMVNNQRYSHNPPRAKTVFTAVIGSHEDLLT